MSTEPTHETLRRIFDVVVREAEHNPALAAMLAQAMAHDGESGRVRRKPAPRRTFEASQMHAVNILRLHGEAALRGRLEQIRAAGHLKAVATASGLVLSGAAAGSRATRAVLIDGIVAAAKHYDAQRSAATS
jgi:hypothetical protein